MREVLWAVVALTLAGLLRPVGAHEVGHYLGLHHTFQTGGSLLIKALVVEGRAITYNGVSFKVNDIKGLSCLEVVPLRDGGSEIFFAFSDPQTEDGNAVRHEYGHAFMHHGIGTDAELGLSTRSTSEDRCGAAGIGVRTVDALTWKVVASTL